MARKRNIHYKTDSVDNKKEPELKPFVKYVKECWGLWDNHWGSRLSDFERYYDLWIGKPPQRDQEWQADFNKKLIWQAVSVLTARFHSALFPISAPIDTDTPETSEEFGAILSKSLVAHWFKIGKFSKEFLSGMKSAGIYGTGFFEDDWYQRVEPFFKKVKKDVPNFVEMRDPEGNLVMDERGAARAIQNGTKSVTQMNSDFKVVEDRYRVRKANIFAWRIHPNKLSDEDDFPVIKQEFITFDALVEFQSELEKYGLGSFENMEDIRKDTFKIKSEDLKRLEKDGNFIDKRNPRLEILHYWGKYVEVKGDEGFRPKQKQRPVWGMVVNRKWRLKLVDNPFWHKKPPLFHIVWTEDEKPSYYGIGLAQIGESAEKRANTVVNIRTDERKKNVKGGGWYNASDKKINKKAVQKNIPGLWKGCTDVNNCARPDIPIPSTPDDYKEEEVSVSDFRETTGATASLLPGDKKDQPNTLGGMKLLLGESLARLKPDLAMMEMMGVRQMANRGFLLTRQFYTQAETIELIASTSKLKQLQVGKLYRIEPEKIIEKVNFHATGLSESIEKAQNIDNLMRYAAATAKVEPMQQVTNYAAIAKKVALWLGFEDVEEFVVTNPFNVYGQGVPGIGQIQPQGAPGGQVSGQGAPGAAPGGAQGGLPPEVISQIAQSIGQNRGGT